MIRNPWSTVELKFSSKSRKCVTRQGHKESTEMVLYFSWISSQYFKVCKRLVSTIFSFQWIPSRSIHPKGSLNTSSLIDTLHPLVSDTLSNTVTKSSHHLVDTSTLSLSSSYGLPPSTFPMLHENLTYIAEIVQQYLLNVSSNVSFDNPSNEFHIQRSVIDSRSR